MSEESPRRIVRRRARPSKAPLSRDLIVATALDILERDGLDGLSLRRVAVALDTGAASLYVYLTNLGDLHALMLDRALESVRVPQGPDRAWRDRLKDLLISYRRVLLDRRGLAQLALSTIAAGPHSLRLWEEMLSLLKEGGADDVEASWGLDLLLLYVTAVAAEMGSRPEGGQLIGRVKEALLSAPAEIFPHLASARETLVSGDVEARFRWSIDLITDGIAGGRSGTR